MARFTGVRSLRSPLHDQGALINAVRLVPLLLLSGLIFSCSDSVQIREGEYGVKTHAGELVEIVRGPGITQRSFPFDHVAVYPRKRDIELTLPGQKAIRLTVEIIDPVQFHKAFASRFDILVGYCEKRLSIQESPAELLANLNDSSTGIVADMRDP